MLRRAPHDANDLVARHWTLRLGQREIRPLLLAPVFPEQLLQLRDDGPHYLQVSVVPDGRLGLGGSLRTWR